MVKNRSKKTITVHTIVFIIFALLAFSLIFPFIWLFLNSLKMDVEFRADSFALPTRWIFANYYDALTYVHKDNTIFNMFLNSILNIIITVVPSTFFATCTSYVLAKYKFKLNGLIFTASLIIMIIPSVGSTAATFKLWHDLGIYDTYFSLFLMGAGGFSSGYLLFYASFKNLSWTYAEAGLLDGASHFRVFFSIMLPQIMPVIVSMVILNVIGVWNDFFTPYMYLPTKPTIAVGIYEVQANAITKQQYPLFFAMMFLSMLPVMLIFIFMQNTIMENVTAGGIKG